MSHSRLARRCFCWSCLGSLGGCSRLAAWSGQDFLWQSPHMFWGLGCSDWDLWVSVSVASFNPELFDSTVISQIRMMTLQNLLSFSLRCCTRSHLPHCVNRKRPGSPMLNWWAVGSLPGQAATAQSPGVPPHVSPH